MCEKLILFLSVEATVLTDWNSSNSAGCGLDLQEDEKHKGRLHQLMAKDSNIVHNLEKALCSWTLLPMPACIKVAYAIAFFLNSNIDIFICFYAPQNINDIFLFLFFINS